MKDLLHAFQLNRWDLLTISFRLNGALEEREAACMQEPLGHLPRARACLLEWADILFIDIIVTFTSNTGTFFILVLKTGEFKSSSLSLSGSHCGFIAAVVTDLSFLPHQLCLLYFQLMAPFALWSHRHIIQISLDPFHFLQMFQPLPGYFNSSFIMSVILVSPIPFAQTRCGPLWLHA